MSRPSVITINSVSGGGKTSLAKSLGDKLSSSQVFHFDDFDETNVYPDDFVAWCKRGAHVEEFDFPDMHAAVRECYQNRDVQVIVLDYPFGRQHPCLRDLITYSIFIDTPLDVALARRVLRDYLSEKSDAKTIEKLKHELVSYLSSIREVYLASEKRYRDEADWILDGKCNLQTLTTQVLAKIQATQPHIQIAQSP